MSTGVQGKANRFTASISVVAVGEIYHAVGGHRGQVAGRQLRAERGGEDIYTNEDMKFRSGCICVFCVMIL